METSRRIFLKVAGCAAAGSAAACKVLERGVPERYSVEKPPVPQKKGARRGEETRVTTSCLQCPGGCGLVVRVVDGRAVKIDGNPAYPTNQGGLCPKGQNGLQVLYDPDRIRTPLQRTGARGAGKWAPISWGEAIAKIAGQLRDLRRTGDAHRVAVIGGRYRGHMRPLVRRFLAAYGSPNDIGHESMCSETSELAHYLTQGVRERLAVDWEHTRYVLSFGAGLIESFVPTAMMLRVFGQLRGGSAGARTKIVQIDPRCGVSALRADEWVAIRPGTDGALALGLAHVLVREKLYDQRFVSERTLGFEPFRDAGGRSHTGFKELVLESYAPPEVEKITGVPASTIERLARELAAHRPAVVVSGRGVAAHTNGMYACFAIHALNALLGGIDQPGGVMVQRHPPFATWPEPELDDVARRGLSEPRLDLEGDPSAAPFGSSAVAWLADGLDAGRPYPLAAAFFYYTNPLFSAPQPEKLRGALEKVPLIASFSPFMDETTSMADLVLPDHTYLERWQLDEVLPSTGFPVFSVRQPVIAPLHDTRSTGEVLIEIARAIGGSVAASFDKSELDMIKDLVRGVHASGTGSIKEPDFDAFWERLLAAGGWWDGPYQFGDWRHVLRTPSGKFELYSTRLEERLTEIARKRWPDAGEPEGRDRLLAELNMSARGDRACLPHHEEAALPAPAAKYPFILNSYKTMTHAEGRGGNQPHLLELYGVVFDRSWEPWAEIHPDDAQPLGIRDGDLVSLESPAGLMKVKAVLYEGTTRGVVSVPFGFGHEAYGRWATLRGENVNQVLDVPVDRMVGAVARYDLRVMIRKA